MSKLILFEFRCSDCGTVFTELVQPDVYEASCSDCGNTAQRIVSAARIDWRPFVHGRTASEPAVDKWDKMRRKKMDIEKRKLEDHGTYD